jgi:hypothetical protein
MESQQNLVKATKTIRASNDNPQTLTIVAEIFQSNNQENKTVTAELTSDG